MFYGYYCYCYYCYCLAKQYQRKLHGIILYGGTILFTLKKAANLYENAFTEMKGKPPQKNLYNK